MRRRFENIKTVVGGKIPVFACSISAPTTTWRKPVPILGCRYRSNGATMAASYVPILYSPWYLTNFMILLCLNIEILSSSA